MLISERVYSSIEYCRRALGDCRHIITLICFFIFSFGTLLVPHSPLMVTKKPTAILRSLLVPPSISKVFDRGNALETASLVMDNLLDLSGSTCSERIGCVGDWTPDDGGGGVSGGGSTLGEQRRYADVASDLARSRVFTSVLLDTGRLASFLRGAVAVLVQAAADVCGRLSTDGAATTTTEGRGGSPSRSAGPRAPQRRVTRPEPLLRALCSFCLEHSPARSTFIRALLDGSSDSGTGAGGAGGNRAGTAETAAAATTAAATAAAEDPCAALFTLCLHPHEPSAAAASTLLQCLLVGGGALGAVSGPSPGAAAGVGVIPAGFILTPIGGGGGGGGSGWVGAAGVGKEDPLQAALLERIGAVALGTADGRRQRHRQHQTPRRSRVGAKHPGRGGALDDIDGNNATLSREYLGRGVGHGRGSGRPESSGSEGDGDDTEDDDSEGWFGCGLGGGSLKSPAGLTVPPATAVGTRGAVRHLILRLGQIGGDLASARAQQQLGLVEPGRASARLAAAGSTGSPSPCPSTPPCAAREDGGGELKARGVEMEQELMSVLCLLSSLVSLIVSVLPEIP